METVIETPAYLAAANRAGMTEVEMTDAVNTISADPQAGDKIKGSGGVRKVRIAGRGFGKSGGYRVFTYYVSTYGVFLLTVISKGKAANLTQAQINVLAVVTKAIEEKVKVASA